MKNLSAKLKELPHEAKFTITMAADSTTEVWTDITTHLDGNDGWFITRLDWAFENIDPTIPFNIYASAPYAHMIQIHRNLDNTTLLSWNDDDVVVNHSLGLTNVNILPVMPFSIQVDQVTTQKKLRVMFRTTTDNTVLSATTVQLAGRLYYHVLKGPNVGHTKLGKIKEF